MHKKSKELAQKLGIPIGGLTESISIFPISEVVEIVEAWPYNERGEFVDSFTVR